ncbi:TetR/AcrR family transcriptional regulator [Actinomadura chokoriensis]|uniref:TetR/AcrR family transcriptional regulator n=1 Tax=Actinomadura chokoriensis TaxID=454156 RepID=A0ABV4R3B6_9ACTN
MSERSASEAPQGLRAAGVTRTRRAIVAAARKHLIEAGYHRLSLEQVAADAGITRVTIYRQFSSKLGLLDAVAEDLAQRARLVSGVEAALTVDDPVAAFQELVVKLCRFWDTDPDLLRRLLGLATVDPEAGHVVQSREQWRFDQIAAFVRRLDAAGRLHDDLDVEQAVAVIGAVTGFPACDEMATRLRLRHAELGPLVVTLLSGVIRLD